MVVCLSREHKKPSLETTLVLQSRGVMMSIKSDCPDNIRDPGRREIIRAAGAVTLASAAGSAFVMNSSAFGQDAPDASARTSLVGGGNAPLGARIQGVQHFGITV